SDRSPSPINEDAIDDSTSTSILLSMEPNNTNDNTKIWQVNRVYK
ncbi:19797_t:CDS:1, partial [Rhizophagus irregularis]